MRLTTKGHFAVTAMLDLSLYGKNNPITLASISQRQGISLPYLEQLFSKLRRNTLVEGIRGPKGGYRLAKIASEISIAAILRAVGEPLDATQCHGKENCKGATRCMMHSVWTHLNQIIDDFLTSMTLEHLEQHQKRQHLGTARLV